MTVRLIKPLETLKKYDPSWAQPLANKVKRVPLAKLKKKAHKASYCDFNIGLHEAQGHLTLQVVTDDQEKFIAVKRLLSKTTYKLIKGNTFQVSLLGRSVEPLLEFLENQIDATVYQKAMALYRQYQGKTGIAVCQLTMKGTLIVNLNGTVDAAPYVKMIEDCDGQFKQLAQAWEVRISYAESLLRTLEQHNFFLYWPHGRAAFDNFLVNPQIQEKIHYELTNEKIKSVRRSTLESLLLRWEQADFNEVSKGLRGYELNPAQQLGIKAAVDSIKAGLHGVILALDMGLGKTLTAILLAITSGLKPTIIAPLSTHNQWREELATVGCENYVLRHWHHTSIGKEESAEILILDEAHLISGDLRTIQGVALDKLASNSFFVIALTGTPFKNGDPANLLRLLKAIGKVNHHNQSRYAQLTLQVNNGRNKVRSRALQDIKREFLDTGFISLQAEDYIELPPLKHRKIMLQTSEERREIILDHYYQLMRQTKEWHFAKVLKMFTLMRYSFAIAKVQTAIELANSLVGEGKQVIVFSNYLEVLKAIKRSNENFALITGEITPENRNITLQKFKQNRVKALACSYKVGGVGLNLQDTSNELGATEIILVDLPWTPAEFVQAIGRLYRQGQQFCVNVHYLSCALQSMPREFVNIDDFLERSVIQKTQNITTVLGAVRSYLNAVMQLTNKQNEHNYRDKRND
jgi:SNF2 family DNA or RNA helicase